MKMGLKGIKIGSGFKLSKSGKIQPDEAARIAKLPVNKRIAARASSAKKIRYVKGKS